MNFELKKEMALEADFVKEMANETDFARGLERYKGRLGEMVEKIITDDEPPLMLDSELENLKKKNLELLGKIASIKKNVKETSFDLVHEEFENLLIENMVLEYTILKAATEFSSVKKRVREMGTRMCKLEANIKDFFYEKVLTVDDNSDEDVCSNEIPKVDKFSESTKCDAYVIANHSPPLHSIKITGEESIKVYERKNKRIQGS